MIWISCALAAILFVAHGAVAQSSPPPGKAQATAQQVLGRFFSDFDEASPARDIERFFAFFEDSPDLVFAFNGKVTRGFDAVKKMHAESWAQLESVRFKTIPESVVVLDANTVLVTAQGISHVNTRMGA